MYKIPANTLFVGQNLVYVPECHSTNSLLAELNDRSELPEGTVLISSRQTAGRGQRGNVWESEPGMNLTFSILFRPKFLATKDQFQLNMAASLGVADALQPLVSQTLSLKWPNDILVENNKIGGILIESQPQGASLSSSIVGVGLNINQQNFSYPQASSVRNFSGLTYNLDALFQQLMGSIESKYLDLRAGNASGLKLHYLTALYKFRQPHHFAAGEEEFAGLISDVDRQGRLCIESKGVTRKFSFKEVQILP